MSDSSRLPESNLIDQPVPSVGHPQVYPEEHQLITQVIHEHENHTHSYSWAEMTPYGLREAICACGHGLQVDPSIHDIVDGKIVGVS